MFVSDPTLHQLIAETENPQTLFSCDPFICSHIIQSCVSMSASSPRVREANPTVEIKNVLSSFLSWRHCTLIVVLSVCRVVLIFTLIISHNFKQCNCDRISSVECFRAGDLNLVVESLHVNYDDKV